MQYETDEEDKDFVNGILRDGGRYRVPVKMLDSIQRSVRENFKQLKVADQFGDDGLGLCRPGPRVLAGGSIGDQLVRDGAARDRAEAYQDWERDATNAWRDADALTDIKKSANDAADAYAAYDDDLENAWRRG